MPIHSGLKVKPAFGDAVEESNPLYPGWRVVGSAAGALFFSFGCLLIFTFGVFLKPIALQFGWSRQSVSLAFGIAAICIALCPPVLGALLDRVPPQRVLVPCFVVYGIAFTSLSLLTPHLWHLYLVFVVIGIVGNGTAHLAYSGALSTWFQARRGMAFALLMSGGGLGAIVLPAAAQRLIDSFGWRAAFVVLGAGVLGIGLPLASRVRRRYDPAPRTDPGEGASAVQGLKSWSFWIIVAVLFAASLGLNGALTHLAPLLTDRGIAPSTAALAISILGVATLVGKLITGWLLDRFFAPRVSFALLAVAGLGIYVLSGAGSAVAGYTAAALIGFGMGAEADVTPYLLSRYFGLRSFSVLYGYSWTAYSFAGAVGPVIMGRAFDLTGSYQALLVRLSIFTVATAALLLFLPRYGSSEPVEQLAEAPQLIS